MAAKTVKVKIPYGDPISILKESGYSAHWKGEGWIRYLDFNKRFHINFNGVLGCYQLHCDKKDLDNKKHYVLGWIEMLRIEVKRIKKISNKYRPSNKSRYAPNLMELQRNKI